MSNKKHAAGYVVLVVFAIIAVAYGLASAYGLQSRLAQIRAGEVHRKILPDETCASCHTSKHKAPLVGACENCHVKSTWQSVSYRHASDYLNRDSHVKAPCNSCHLNGGEIKNASCGTCHKTYAHKVSPQCILCHTTKSWTASHKLPKQHPKLAGTHKKATCPDCHTIHDVERTWYCEKCHSQKKHNPIVTKQEHRQVACVDCHIRKRGSDNLNKVSVKANQCSRCHVAPHQKLDRCERCHVKNSFKTKRYAHRSWRLRGAHAKLDCTKCHAMKRLGVAKGTSCAACHGLPHGGLPDCLRCHTQTSFKTPKFSHDAAYPLAGAHRKLQCSQCHPAKQWAKTKGTACSSCHGVRHGGLTKCLQCHTTSAFKPSKFNHSSQYPLTGRHARIACSKCHRENNYTQVKGRTCRACHGIKHGGQTNCGRCHTTKAWQPIKPIAHTSSYPLTGQHRYVECIGCHKRLNFNYTPTRCVDCHASLSHGMSYCESCHTTESWTAVKSHFGG